MSPEDDHRLQPLEPWRADDAGTEMSAKHPTVVTRLYCLDCGYNLRGLARVDPLRCPECGYRNPLGDLELPAEAIARELANLETSPVINFISIWILIVVMGATLSLLIHQSLTGLDCLAVFLILAATVGVLLLINSWRSFKGGCRNHANCGTALINYHAYASALFVVTGTACAAAGAGVFALIDALGVQADWVRGVIVVLAFGALCLLVTLWAKFCYRRAKGPMERLQRDTAVEIARHVLRSRLGRHHRPWPGYKEDDDS